MVMNNKEQIRKQINYLQSQLEEIEKQEHSLSAERATLEARLMKLDNLEAELTAQITEIRVESKNIRERLYNIPVQVEMKLEETQIQTIDEVSENKVIEAEKPDAPFLM